MTLKEIIWISSSKKDLLSLPENVMDFMGYGLFLAQKGQQHGAAKVLKGFGSAGLLKLLIQMHLEHIGLFIRFK